MLVKHGLGEREQAGALVVFANVYVRFVAFTATLVEAAEAAEVLGTGTASTLSEAVEAAATLEAATQEVEALLSGLDIACGDGDVWEKAFALDEVWGE